MSEPVRLNLMFFSRLEKFEVQDTLPFELTEIVCDKIFPKKK
jgi:hypothetical protein